MGEGRATEVDFGADKVRCSKGEGVRERKEGAWRWPEGGRKRGRERGRQGGTRTDRHGAKRTDAETQRNWDDGWQSEEGEGGLGVCPLRPGG